MARAGSLARARLLERSATAYVIQVGSAAGPVDVDVTWAELARDAVWATERMRALGLERGHRVLLTFSGFEGPWFQPVLEAFRTLGVVYATAEAMGWDHNRTFVFHRELDLHAVLGLSADTLEGLSGQAMLGKLFADTPVVQARPAAARRLRAAGIPAGVLTPLGPALAVECAERAGAHVNAAEWRVDERDGGLVLTPEPGRAPGLAEIPLDEPGQVVHGTCACGSDDPRVLFH